MVQISNAGKINILSAITLICISIFAIASVTSGGEVTLGDEIVINKPSIGTYDSSLDKNKVSVTDTFLGTDTAIADIALKTVPVYDSEKKKDVYKAPIGKESLILSFDAQVYSEKTEAISEVLFIDQRPATYGNLLNKDYSYKVLVSENVTEQRRDTICDRIYLNGSTECRETALYNVTVQKDTWKLIKSPALLEGSHTLGVFTEIKKGDYFDAVPILYGMEINKWVIVASDPLLNHYWNFNETSGTMGQDAIVPQHNLTLNSAWRVSYGKNGYGLNITASNQQTVTTTINLNGVSAITYNIWIYKYGSFAGVNTGSLFGNTNNANSAGKFTLTSANCGDQANQIGIDIYDTVSRKGLGNCTTVPDNAWTMVTVLINSSNAITYFNGTIVKNHPLTSFAFTSANLRFFSDTAGTNLWHNSLADEKMMWNRSLTTTEITTELYNSHIGFFHPFESSSVPNVTLVYPTNTTYTGTNKPTGINITIQNSSAVTCAYSTNNFATNTTFSPCASNVSGLTASEGTNIWGVVANYSTSLMNITTVTFQVDSTAPNLSIVYPTNTTYSVNVSALNYTCSDGAYAIYSRDSGTTNSTPSACGTNFSNVLSVEGSNIWTLFLNDTMGNLNSTSMTFTKDTLNPLASYGTGTDANYSNVTRNYIIVNVSVTDTTFANTTIRLFNSTSSLINSTTLTSNPSSITFLNLSNGIYYFNSTVYDSFARSNVTSTYLINLSASNDLYAPNVTLVYPTNAEVTLLQSQMPALINYNFAIVDNIAVTNITYRIDDIDGTEIYADTSTTENFSVSLPRFTTYYVNITASDAVGNVNSTIYTLKLTKQGEQGGFSAFISRLFNTGSIADGNSSALEVKNNQNLSSWTENVLQKYGGLMLIGFLVVLFFYSRKRNKR